MEKIAQKAGISKSNLYNYFKAKDEIFNSITDSAAFYFRKVINHFYEDQFSPKFGEIGFNEMLTKQIFNLVSDHKDGLILLMKCSAGTRYEQLKAELMKQIANKFLRDYATDFSNAELLVTVITENLFDGITSLTVCSKSDDELRMFLDDFIKYHSYGFSALISCS